jgi:hypothetical protein
MPVIRNYYGFILDRLADDTRERPPSRLAERHFTIKKAISDYIKFSRALSVLNALCGIRQSKPLSAEEDFLMATCADCATEFAKREFSISTKEAFPGIVESDNGRSAQLNCAGPIFEWLLHLIQFYVILDMLPSYGFIVYEGSGLVF